MTDEAPKPKRKRQRWIIAGVLLFVVAAGEWYWPRGDARFVGEWAVYPDVTSSQRGGTFQFDRNGTGWFGWRGATYFTVWDTNDGDLHFGLRFAESRLVGALKSMTGPMTWMTTMRYEIETIDGDTITLRNGPPFQPTAVLRRLPE